MLLHGFRIVVVMQEGVVEELVCARSPKNCGIGEEEKEGCCIEGAIESDYIHN
jgi:hypothetical protein